MDTKSWWTWRGPWRTTLDDLVLTRRYLPAGRGEDRSPQVLRRRRLPALLMLLLEVEAHPRSEQMLAQVAILPRVELSTSVVEVPLFNERRELRGEVVICARYHLPREIGMAFASAGADHAVRGIHLDIG